MKNLFIASLMLFSFTLSAQNVKDTKKDRGSSTQSSVKAPSSNRAATSSKPSNFTEKDSKGKPAKPVSKPVGAVKPSKMTPANSASNEKPVVKGQASSPAKPTKPMSSSRAAATSSKPNSFSEKDNKGKPAKPVSKPVGAVKPSKMTPANSASNEKPVVKGQASSPSKPMSSSRAAATNSKPNSFSEKDSKGKPAKPVSKPVGTVGSNKGVSSADFCKGWEDGYIKGWNLNKKQQEKPRVPNCAVSNDCKDYKCGYKMGMKRAETDNRK
jgi:hypothetical protein